MEIVSIVLAYVALAAGAAAALAMLIRMGRPGDKARPALLWVHRVAGYVFLALMIFLFAGMLFKIAEYGEALSPRVAWHGAAGFAVMAFLFLKWAVVRPFRGLLKLAPALGITAFVLAFVVLNFGATMNLLDRLAARRAAAAPAADEVAAAGDAAGVEAPTAPGKGMDALHAARFVFAEKCGRCHHLRRPFDNPRPADQWTPLLKRMQSYDAGGISDADVMEIEFYVTSDYGPGR